MPDDSIPQSLRRLPHFQALPADLLDAIAAGVKRRTLSAGELLFVEGDPCDAFFAIRAGAMKLYRSTPDGRERVVHDLRAGATFAEAALLSFGRFPVSASALETPTELLQIGAQPFLKLFREDPRLAAAMVSSLSMRLVDLVERVDELAMVQAGSRLARWLLRQPATRGEPPAVELGLAKKDLAAHLAMTPETLSRLLRRWQDERWIVSERSRIVLQNAERLLEVADGADGSA